MLCFCAIGIGMEPMIGRCPQWQDYGRQTLGAAWTHDAKSRFKPMIHVA